MSESDHCAKKSDERKYLQEGNTKLEERTCLPYSKSQEATLDDQPILESPVAITSRHKNVHDSQALNSNTHFECVWLLYAQSVARVRSVELRPTNRAPFGKRSLQPSTPKPFAPCSNHGTQRRCRQRHAWKLTFRKTAQDTPNRIARIAWYQSFLQVIYGLHANTRSLSGTNQDARLGQYLRFYERSFKDGTVISCS